VDAWILTAQLYVAVVLGVAAALDAIYREVDPELWLASLPLALVLGAASIYTRGYPGPLWLPYAMGGLLFLAVTALYLLGLIGGADVGAVALLWLGVPVAGEVLPALYTSLLYSAPLAAGYYLVKLGGKCGLSCVVRGYRVRGEELLGMRWWAPRGYRLEADVHELVAVEGLYGSYVRASPLLPWVTVLYLGYLASLALGDRPILALLEALAG